MLTDVSTKIHVMPEGFKIIAATDRAGLQRLQIFAKDTKGCLRYHTR